MQTKVVSKLWLTLLVTAAPGCHEPSGVGAPPAHSTAEEVPTDVASAAQADPTAPVPISKLPAETGEPGWRRAVRLERYREARDLLEALPDAEKGKPEMKFLRARVAARLKEYKSVRSILEGVSLPMFDDELTRLRAEAAAEVGPYAEALAYYERSGRPRDLVKAALAAQKSGEPKRAVTLADRALTEAQRLKRTTDERVAHGARSQILVEQKKTDQALGDLKWLATHAPTSSEGRFARKTIEANGTTLTDKEKRAVIDALLDAGAGKEATEAIDKWGKSFSRAELLHRRAEAYFKSRSYKKAADAFTAASKVESGRTAEQLYYAARSLARSKKEEEALKLYREVMKRFHKGLWVERSAYQLAQLLQNQGKFQEAAEAFTSFLAKFSDTSNRDDAEYALALAHLSSKEPAKAKTVLGRLASRAKRTEWGFLRELEGVAALRAGQTDEAQRIFVEVATEQPLTWGALMARARLAKMSANLPPLVTVSPDRPTTPLPLAMPAKAAQLMALGLDADAESHIAENEATASAAYSGRETEALCGMYGKLSRAKRRYKVGAAAVSFESLMRAPSASDRWSWECLYPAPYQQRVSELETEYAISKGLLHSLMRQESAFDPDARSPVGAEGLMQLMPSTAEQAAKEAKLDDFRPDDVGAPETNIKLGAFYISKLLRTFDGSIPLAVASYNAGPGAVSRWVETAKELEADLFVARIPYEETRTYVQRVMGNLARYQWLSGGETAVAAAPLELPRAANATEDDY